MEVTLLNKGNEVLASLFQPQSSGTVMDKEKFRALEQRLDCVPVSKLHTNLRKSVPGMSNNSTHTDADLACLHGFA